MSIKEIFSPNSVCIIGASEKKNKWSNQILSNLISGGYKGNIYPINPKSKEILGYKCYKSVSDIEYKIDLAVIVIPAPLVGPALAECGCCSIKSVVIISAGFGEVGNVEGEQDLKDIANYWGIDLIGPNTFGCFCRSSGINVSLIGDL